VILKNGKDVPEPVVTTTRISMSLMLLEHPEHGVALSLLAAEPGWPVDARSRDYLTSIGLLQHDGQMHDAVRAVVLNELGL